MSKIICIDAGHGGKDSGAVNGNRYEKNDNLRFALALGTVLTRCGFRVFQTRTSDATLSLQDRTNFANRLNAHYFISVHRNSHTLSFANGVENWIYKNTDKATADYATAIQDELVKVGVQSDRGVKKGNFHVTRETKMPACLLELGFIKNAKDNALYDSKFNDYVEAVVKGICKFNGVAYVLEKPVEQAKPTSQKMGKWCVGNFNEQTKDRADVATHLDALRKIGYGVWYEQEK